MAKTPHPLSAVGDFYVERDCCTLCGVPRDVAPDLFSYDDTGCWVARQPADSAQEAKMVEVFARQDLRCIRYRGREPRILHALEAVGERRQCDQPLEAARAVVRPSPVGSDVSVPASRGRGAGFLLSRFVSWLRKRRS